MKPLHELGVKLFGDGADKATMLEFYANPLIRGFTTNPTLMRKAGVTNYESICARSPGRDPRPSDLAGSVCGRIPGDGAASAPDCRMGR